MGPRELPALCVARQHQVRPIAVLVGAVVTTVVWAAPASAHVELVTSSPGAGANLSTAPTKVSTTVDDELDPDLGSFTVTGPGSATVGSGEVDLTVADRNVMIGSVTTTAPPGSSATHAEAGGDGAPA